MPPAPPTPLDSDQLLPLNRFPPGVVPFPCPSPDASSLASSTEAFKTGIDQRDEDSCVICGFARQSALDHCHLVRRDDHETWKRLIAGRWLPSHLKTQKHEPRNGLLLCKNHHYTFDSYEFFIRLVPERNAYVFINFCDYPEFRAWHDQPLRLDPSSPRAPFGNLLYYHENLCWANQDPAGTLPMPRIRRVVPITPPAAAHHPTAIAGNDGDSSDYDDDPLSHTPATNTLRPIRRTPRESLQLFDPRDAATTSTPSASSSGYPSDEHGPRTDHSSSFPTGVDRFDVPPGYKVALCPLPPIDDPVSYFSPVKMRQRYHHRNWLDEKVVGEDGTPHRWNRTAADNIREWHQDRPV